MLIVHEVAVRRRRHHVMTGIKNDFCDKKNKTKRLFNLTIKLKLE